MDKPKPVYYSDCAHFRGDIPCRPHKELGLHCINCIYYQARKGNILIIKLGAIGDVIRTTTLLRRIRKEYPGVSVWWLTETPEIVPQQVERILPMNLKSALTLQATDFDILINLDKDPHACALAKTIKADKKYGFILKEGKPAPANMQAEHKFLTGIFDDVNQNNTKSYPEEIFEICEWKFNGEEYILDIEQHEWDIPNGGKAVIGLNTGCGGRWPSRLWKDDYWAALIDKLIAAAYFPILLGGSQEDEKNKSLSEKTGAYYPGHFPLKQFISLVDQCQLVVTAVTMGLHIAVGLKKKVVLMNNIFNRHEFELYGRGEIIEPEKPCRCFFNPECKNEEYFCMDTLLPETIFSAVEKQLRD